MQPDNIRPPARIPKLTFSDDIVHFQSKVLRSRRQLSALNATIPLISLSAKTGNYSSACALVRRCGRLAVAFLPQVLRFRVDFWAGVALLPNHGHPAAINVDGRLIRQSSSARQNCVQSLSVQFPGVVHVVGVRSLRSLPEED